MKFNHLLKSVFAVTVCGCASTGIMKLTTETFPAKPKNCPIEVFNAPPKKAHIELARLNARSGQSIFEGKGLDSMLPGLKEEACKLGADAIILGNVQEGGYNFSGPADRGNASATAIKFKGK